MAILSIVFVGRQVEQNADGEVQQLMNNEVDDILFFEDCAVFSLRFVLCLSRTLFISFDTRTKLFPVSVSP